MKGKRDVLQRFIFEHIRARGEIIHLSKSYRTIIKQHNYAPAVRGLLGEALCVVGMLSATIKFPGRMTLQFRGKGKLQLLLAQCTNDFKLRGLVKASGDLTEENLKESFQEGILTLMFDSYVNKNRTQGIVAWRGDSLAESIEGYFQDSEQLDTTIKLVVDDKQASGLLLQVIPHNEESQTQEWQRLKQLTQKISNEDLQNLQESVLLQQIYPDDEIRLFNSDPVVFQCTCSRARGEQAIALLDQKEIDEELEKSQIIVVTCDFCNTEYPFDRHDIQKIINNRPDPSTPLH